MTLLVGVGLLFLAWPTWLTGGASTITIREILFYPTHGGVDILTDSLIPYGAQVEWESPPREGLAYTHCQAWHEEPGPFLRWPIHARPTSMRIELATDDERKVLPIKGEVVQRRLVIGEETFRLQAGEERVYYRRTEPNGRLVEYRVRCRRSP